MRTLFACLLILTAASIVSAANPPASPKPEPVNPHWAQKWNYVHVGFANDADADKLIDLLKQSADAGCTHIALGVSGMNRVDLLTNPDYIARVAKVRAAADQLHLTIIPMIFPLGYGGETLRMDGNLMCGLPVKDVPFIIKGTTGQPDPASAAEIKNGGFETAEGDKLADWEQSGAGKFTFVDKQEKHGGDASLKISVAPKAAVRGNEGMIVQKIKVKPFQYYRLVCWLKSPDIGISSNLFSATGHSGQKLMAWESYPPEALAKQAKTDWVQFSVILDTLDNEEITIKIGNEWGRAGTLWIDDVHFEPAGFMLALHRSTVPVVVTSQDGKTTYVEGKDYKPVIDPVVDNFPKTGDLDINHPAVPLELTDGSAIKDGQTVLVSYYHTTQINEDQNVVTMQDPQVLKDWDASMAELVKVWPAPGYFMSGYDEIRMGGWEPNPDNEKLTMGQILARHTTAAYNIIKKYAPTATVYTWSDMYTPFHNASTKSAYYWLCNGNYDKSWEGIPKDMVIMNWYAQTPDGIKFFADKGYHQVLCGYYDVKGTPALQKGIRDWITVSAGQPGVDGMMYTTWNKNFKYMKEFFQLVDSYPNWTTAPAAAR